MVNSARLKSLELQVHLNQASIIRHFVIKGGVPGTTSTTDSRHRPSQPVTVTAQVICYFSNTEVNFIWKRKKFGHVWTSQWQIQIKKNKPSNDFLKLNLHVCVHASAPVLKWEQVSVLALPLCAAGSCLLLFCPPHKLVGRACWSDSLSLLSCVGVMELQACSTMHPVFI